MRSPAELLTATEPAPDSTARAGEARAATVSPPSAAWRRALEAGFRLAALVLIAWAIWSATRPAARGAVLERATAEQLEDRLALWSGERFPDSVRLGLDRAPSPVERAWLRALRGAGVAVGWSDEGIAPLALEVVPLAEPRGGTTILAASDGETSLALADEVGVLDTLRTDGPGGTLRAPRVVGVVTARAASASLSAVAVDSIAPRTVRVLGAAGWESRFVTMALEERGWTVEARFAVAPGLDVAQGGEAPLDTARHAAVIALDGTASRDLAAIRRFVAQGGGLVLGGEAVGLVGFRELASVAAGALAPPPDARFAGPAPRRALPLRPLTALDADAVPVERRDDRTAVVARRVGAGRVVATGYSDTWRWRMEGEGDATAAHAAWWSALVAAAAHRPAHPTTAPPTDPAPRAATFAALGPPSAAPSAAAGTPVRAAWPAPWLLPAVLLLLLAEWASRRLRGAR